MGTRPRFWGYCDSARSRYMGHFFSVVDNSLWKPGCCEKQRDAIGQQIDALVGPHLANRGCTTSSLEFDCAGEVNVVALTVGDVDCPPPQRRRRTVSFLLVWWRIPKFYKVDLVRVASLDDGQELQLPQTLPLHRPASLVLGNDPHKQASYPRIRIACCVRF